jgi:hypothetical protein
MTGKRAKPSPWRFLRAAPVLVVAAVVWVMVGLFLLLPGSGGDQAHDWGLDPIPSNSSSGDEAASAPEPVTPSSSQSSPARTQPSPHLATAPDDGTAPERSTASDLELSGASATARPTARPRPRPTSEPTEAAPTEQTPGPPDDNPGKKKGHDKRHGPPNDQP